MADWATISSLATAGGTLVLAFATFGSIKSANRAARVAEQSLLAGLRPLLIPSREEDTPERVRFGDNVVLTVPGHGGAVRLVDDRVYMAIALRNGGTGLAVIHGWNIEVAERISERSQPSLDDFRRQQRDLYIPAGDTGFWQGAVRERSDPQYSLLRDAAEHRRRVMVDLLFGDHEGGQRTIARFGISDWPEVEGERAEVLRYWNVDRDDPR
jgi:hypothetical protein